MISVISSTLASLAVLGYIGNEGISNWNISYNASTGLVYNASYNGSQGDELLSCSYLFNLYQIDYDLEIDLSSGTSVTSFDNITIDDDYYLHSVTHDDKKIDFIIPVFLIGDENDFSVWYVLDLKGMAKFFADSDVQHSVGYYEQLIIDGGFSLYVSVDFDFYGVIHNDNVYNINIDTLSPYNYQFSNTSLSLGSDVITAVESPLEIVGSLATNFVTGFKSLVWNDTTNELSTVGLFSCLFLGISITFAMIRLAMNLLGKNTGVK